MSVEVKEKSTVTTIALYGKTGKRFKDFCDRYSLKNIRIASQWMERNLDEAEKTMGKIKL